MTQTGYHVTVELKVKEKLDPSTVRDALLKLAAAAKRQPYCTAFSVHQDIDEPQRFVLWEGFQDEAAFKQHGAEPHTQEFNSQSLVELVRISKSIATSN